MLDYLDASGLLSPDELETQGVTRRFVEAEALPEIRDWWERGEFPETVDTYEGNHDIHTLIAGRELTGLGALD